MSRKVCDAPERRDLQVEPLESRLLLAADFDFGDAPVSYGTGQNTTGVQANATSNGPVIGGDGRYVVFVSEASNLVAGDTNGVNDVFRKDRSTGEVVRVSTAADGAQTTVAAGGQIGLSADGRYVVFTTADSGLVAGDTNGLPDAFRKDLTTGAVIRVSTAVDGSQSDGPSLVESITPDGRYVLFQSQATNLVAGDTNGVIDVFLKDLSDGSILRASTDAAGNQVNAPSGSGYVTPDGRYVLFGSFASNLIAGDTNGQPDLFRKDLTDGSIVRVNIRADGSQTAAGVRLRDYEISDDGRYAVFSSDATTLIPGGTSNGKHNGFRKDLVTGEVLQVNVRLDGVQAGPNGDGVGNMDISADGRYVAFADDAGNLVTGDDNGTSDVFVKDMDTGELLGASFRADGVVGNSGTVNPFVDDAGELAAFTSFSDNLVSGDTNGVNDAFIKNLRTGRISRVSTGNYTGPATAPRHTLSGVFLGAGVDGDVNGQPSAAADGDADDGVTFPMPFNVGQSSTVRVTASAAGTLAVWIDYDQNGVFDAAERSQHTLTAGVNDITLNTPADAAVGATYARFRFATNPADVDRPVGAAADGEVEDYAVAVQPFDPPPSVTGIAGSLVGQQATFTVNFSEAVTGVDPSDFVVEVAGDVTFATLSVTGAGSGRTVTVADVAGDGTISLRLVDDDSIVDAALRPLDGAGGAASAPLTVVREPVVTGISGTLDGNSAAFTVTFSEAVAGVDAGDFTLVTTGTAAGALGVISGAGGTWTVAVNGLVGDGTVTLRLVDDDSIRSVAADRPLAGADDGGATSAALPVRVAPAPVDAEIGLFARGRWTFDTDRDGSVDRELSFGAAGDLPFLVDWNGDFRLDTGVFRAGLWMIDTTDDGLADVQFAFGQAGDRPFAADFDGDGIADAGVYGTRGAFSTWTIDYSGTNGRDAAADFQLAFGIPGDVPFVGDWNGDGAADLGLYRNGPATSGNPFMQFFIDLDRDGGAADTEVWFGVPGDEPFLGDWDGDGQLDPGVFRYNPDIQGGVNQFFFDTARDGGAGEQEMWVRPATGSEETVLVPPGRSVNFGRANAGGSGSSGSGSGSGGSRGVRLDAPDNAWIDAADWL